jgi:hypothetical protein
MKWRCNRTNIEIPLWSKQHKPLKSCRFGYDVCRGDYFHPFKGELWLPPWSKNIHYCYQCVDSELIEKEAEK